MGSTKSPEMTRQLILDTALQMFVERGYFATSVHDIRKHAGLSVGAIYHHFGTKEALARALYEDLVARMDGLIEAALRPHRSARERCRAIALTLCETAQESPELLHFILHARHREFLPEAPPICSTRPFETMKQVVSEGIQAGEIRPMDPVAAAAVAFGSVIRLVHLALDGVLAKPSTAYFDAIWEATWRGLSV